MINKKTCKKSYLSTKDENLKYSYIKGFYYARSRSIIASYSKVVSSIQSYSKDFLTESSLH